MEIQDLCHGHLGVRHLVRSALLLLHLVPPHHLSQLTSLVLCFHEISRSSLWFSSCTRQSQLTPGKHQLHHPGPHPHVRPTFQSIRRLLSPLPTLEPPYPLCKPALTGPDGTTHHTVLKSSADIMASSRLLLRRFIGPTHSVSKATVATAAHYIDSSRFCLSGSVGRR